MKPLWIEAAGMVAPGLAGWDAARSVLRGEATYQPAEMPAYAPQLLPPNERRRATAAVRLAFAAAEDALKSSSYAPDQLASVFATSDSDTGILHRICGALAQEPRLVSPTDFHNSVHNAAAGYWSIAAGCRLPSSSISAFDGSFVAGLLEAAALAHGDGLNVLLCCYDMVPPAPLRSVRPLAQPCAAALVLTPQPGASSRARLNIALAPEDETAMDGEPLEALRTGNPAARALPLLRALALGSGAVVITGASGQRWQLTLSAP